jgi:hypothetical protein
LLLLLLALMSAAAAAAAAAAPPPPPPRRTYFISPNGVDDNNGTRQAPWRTTAPLGGAFAAQPGDAVLFEAGALHTSPGNLQISRGGSARQPLTIGAYGPGNGVGGGGGGQATLKGAALQLMSTSNVVVRDIALVGPPGVGIEPQSPGVMLFCTSGHATRCAGVSLTDVSISGFAVGLKILGEGGAGFDGLSLLRVHANDNKNQGIAASGPFPRPKGVYAHRDMSLVNCTAARNLGDPLQTSSHTGSGIVLSNVDGATMRWCSAHSNGWRQASTGGGPVGLWAWEARAVVISHCSSWNNSNGAGVHDGGGFDLDGGVTDSLIEYSASWGNTGSGFMLCQFKGASRLSNNSVRFCLSVGDGYDAVNSGGLELYSPETTEPAMFIGNTVFVASPAARRARPVTTGTGTDAGRARDGVSPPTAVHMMRSDLGFILDGAVQLRHNVLLQNAPPVPPPPPPLLSITPHATVAVDPTPSGPLLFVGGFEHSSDTPTFLGNTYGTRGGKAAGAKGAPPVIRWGRRHNYNSVAAWQRGTHEDPQAVAMKVTDMDLSPDPLFFVDCAPHMDVLRTYDWTARGSVLGPYFQSGDGIPNSNILSQARRFDGKCAADATDAAAAVAVFTVKQHSNNCYGDGPECWFRGRFEDSAACQAVCAADSACLSFTWVGSTGDQFAHECRTRNDTVWKVVPEALHTAGWKGLNPPAPPPFRCINSTSCNNAGICHAGKCKCDATWRGDTCAILSLQPAKSNGNGDVDYARDEQRNTWGGSIVADTTTGSWHMFASEFPNGTLQNWETDSIVIHLTSSTGAQGPYVYSDTVVGPRKTGSSRLFWDSLDCHNPTVHKIGDEYVVFYIGVGVRVNTTRQGRTPLYDKAQSIGAVWSNSPQGPWNRMDKPLLVATESWECGGGPACGVSNPSIQVRSDGMLNMFYRGNQDRGIGVATASKWRGPWVKSANSVKSNGILSGNEVVGLEDMYVFQNPASTNRSGCHMILHQEEAGIENLGAHVFTEDPSCVTGWRLSRPRPSHAYGPEFAWDNGTISKFASRERPQVVLRASDGWPTHLSNGVITSDWHGASFTVVAPINASKLQSGLEY